jgi:hypothetical protein
MTDMLTRLKGIVSNDDMTDTLQTLGIVDTGMNGLQRNGMGESREMLDLVNQFSKSTEPTNEFAYTSMNGRSRTRRSRFARCLQFVVRRYCALTCLASYWCSRFTRYTHSRPPPL